MSPTRTPSTAPSELHEQQPVSVSITDFHKRQAQFDRLCLSLCDKHYEQLTQALRISEAEGPWLRRLPSRLMLELSMWAMRKDLQDIAWSRACQALHHWFWLCQEQPGCNVRRRALDCAREALHRAPERGQAHFRKPLARALLATLAEAPKVP